jgi:hypothetical protein
MYDKTYKRCLWNIILIWDNLAKIKYLKKNPLKGVYQKSISSIKSLKMKCSYYYPWRDHVVGFLKTSNSLVEMTSSTYKHNKLIN